MHYLHQYSNTCYTYEYAMWCVLTKKLLFQTDILHICVCIATVAHVCGLYTKLWWDPLRVRTRLNKSHLVNTNSNGVSDFNFLSLEGASGVRWWSNFVNLSFRCWVWIIKRNISDTRVLSVIKWTHASILFGCKNMLENEHRIGLIPIQTVYGFVWSTYSPLMFCIWVV